ncbi:hypothetical protein KR044_003470 [Drosophila immigrans]|nr:hypothetical protein KR044_003470 [Drosophila immigrans]
MFPNYCFKKQSDDFGYDVMYVPKKNYSSSVRPPSNRPMNQNNARSRTRAEKYTKLCYEDLLTLQALREQNERASLKVQSAAPERNVEFRLPMDKQPQFGHRPSGGSSLSEREMYLKQQQHQQEQQETESPASGEMPTSAAINSEACADFFNIVYDNVLEAVNVAVEQTVDKHFADLLSKVNQLKSEMSVQENMLKQLNADVTTKISELNDTSLNQFKFIAQMLIDSQTIHYRAMNQQRLLKQQRQDEQEAQKRSVSSDRSQQSSDAYSHCHGNMKSPQQHSMQRQQHQLWQQQDPLTYMQAPCSNCHRTIPKQDRAVLRRTRKETTSMPNLHQASMATSASAFSNISGIKMKHQHCHHPSTLSSWSQCGTRRVANATTQPPESSLKKCRCRCHSPCRTQALGHLYGNNSSMGRKSRGISRTMPSRENE